MVSIWAPLPQDTPAYNPHIWIHVTDGSAEVGGGPFPEVTEPVNSGARPPTTRVPTAADTGRPHPAQASTEAEHRQGPCWPQACPHPRVHAGRVAVSAPGLGTAVISSARPHPWPALGLPSTPTPWSPQELPPPQPSPALGPPTHQVGLDPQAATLRAPSRKHPPPHRGCSLAARLAGQGGKAGTTQTRTPQPPTSHPKEPSSLPCTCQCQAWVGDAPLALPLASPSVQGGGLSPGRSAASADTGSPRGDGGCTGLPCPPPHPQPSWEVTVCPHRAGSASLGPRAPRPLHS